jgi:hypothetical protein
MATTAGDIQPTDRIKKRKNNTRADTLSRLLTADKETEPVEQKKRKGHNDDGKKDNNKREKFNNRHNQKITGEGTEESKRSRTEANGVKKTEKKSETEEEIKQQKQNPDNHKNKERIYRSSKRNGNNIRD